MSLALKNRATRFLVAVGLVAGFASAASAFPTPNCYRPPSVCGGSCFIATLGCQWCEELPGECGIEYDECEQFVCGEGCTAGCWHEIEG
jgi:hypothetical protein